MSYIVSVYGERAFKKILLPAVNNSDFDILLYKDIFALDTDIVLKMEILNFQWSFKKSPFYTLTQDSRDYFDTPLKNNDIIQLRTVKKESLTILIYELATPFEVYKKYSLENVRRVTIGNGRENHIQYNYFDMVSKQHAVLEITSQGTWIHDLSANGVFVNGKRVYKSQKLSFGDSIHILGLQMIFLNSLLAVGLESVKVEIDSYILKELDSLQLENAAASYDGNIPEKNCFHRTPRNIEKLEEEAVEIEAPPAPASVRRQSAILSIGPAFTMAVPMLLGSLLSIYGSNRSSAFMYTGLITAVSSAFIATIWATINIRSVRKREKEDEEERQNAYIEYLEKNMAAVKERYEKNTAVLHTRYPSSGICAGYGKDTPVLWNRNQHHEDFLYHRVGLGRIPFQVPILIPKEQFRIKKDELALKPKDIKAAYETLTDVPVGVNFIEHPLIGIVGGKNKVGALKIARNLLIQIAANNCYTDVKLCVVYNKENSYEDACLKSTRWLPHVWAENKKTRYVADSSSDATDVFYEIASVMREREESGGFAHEKNIPKPYYILFITNPEYLEGEALAKYVYDNDGKYGLCTVFLTENYEDLPNSCEYIIQNDRDFQGYYLVTDNISDRVPVKFDETDSQEYESFTRRLSDIEVNEVEKGGEIPNSLTFFDMMEIHSLEELDVASRWRKNRTYESLKALIGQKSGGVPCYLDIHEKYHGPHGLVAGTTGSGKSETLQTYILSLAINYSPYDVGFFVIDYKGGGMANLFTNLPHTIGQISNLSGNQVHRAMVSIKSENRRRQRIFNEHGVNNINNYTRLYKSSEASVPIPHLFIIIDEFAELKREEPDFMRELISVAQVGRSLGVHLILATQKPSGTVDDNIWSNAKFRLCLRVQDRQDSMDMLHKPDAAYITQAGRCYLQVGNDEIYELFQSGWSGAGYDETEGSSKAEIARMLSVSGKAALVGNRLKIKQKEKQKQNWITSIVRVIGKELSMQRLSVSQILEDVHQENGFMEQVFLGLKQAKIDFSLNEYNARRMEDLLQLYAQAEQKGLHDPEGIAAFVLAEASDKGIKIPEIKEKTQLDAVVEYLAAQAYLNGYTNRFMLWMPVLPSILYLTDLKGYAQNCFDGTRWPAVSGPWKLEAYMGMIDDPVNQAQMPLMVNLSEGGHHAVCGTVVTGKSTFLQTFIYSMVHRYTPEHINFYLLDFSSRMLGAFEGLAHVGGIIYENELEKLSRFFNLINEIMDERKRILKGGSYEQYVQANGVPFPAIVIVIDQFANFREKTGGIYEDTLIQISRNGTGYGIYLMITSAGFGMLEIPNRIGDNIRTVIGLEMSDRYQYTDILHTLQIHVFPESGVKGRGLISHNGEILEFQTALCTKAEDDYTRTENIIQECRKMNECWKGRKARPIPEIPENPVFTEFIQLDETRKYLRDDCHLPVGYNKENASIYSIDLSRIFCWIIQGKARTGKTNLLKILMKEAVEKGGKVSLVDLTGSLKNMAEKAGVRHLQNEGEIVQYWKDLLPDIQKRNGIKKQAVEEEMDEQEVYQRMQRETAYYLFIDDLVSFVKLIYQPSGPEYDIRSFMENVTEKGRLYNIYLFAALNQEKISEAAGYKLFTNITRWQAGIHLGGNVASQRILNFDYIPFTEQGKIQKPGIGMLPALEGEADVPAVVIPLDKKKGQEG